MNSLKTTKVVIIDDSSREAVPILKALARLGIGAVYYTGNVDELPDEPLNGIRLVFLDMDLTGSGGDSKKIVGQAVTVLKSVIDENSAPIFIVIWTKQPDYVRDFEEMMEHQLPKLCPYNIAVFEKSLLNDPGQISQAIKQLIESSLSINLIWEWEQKVHDAAVETVHILSQLAVNLQKEENMEWPKAMTEILSAMAQASAGQQLIDGPEAINALYETLNPVHFDSLDRRSHEVPERLGKIATELVETKLVDKLKVPSALNSILLVSDCTSDSNPRPGNVYLKSEWEHPEKRFPLENLEIDEYSLADDIFNYNDQDKNLQKKRKLEALSKSIPLVVEVTPTCDYMQKNNKTVRLVAGLLVPDQLKIKSAAYIEKLEPIQYKGAIYHIVLDARFILGMSLNTLEGVQPTMRLRRQVLVDIQSWYASHAARPGHLSVR